MCICILRCIERFSLKCIANACSMFFGLIIPPVQK